MTMSRILMEPLAFLTFFDSSSTLTTLMRWRLSCATTSSRDGASIVAVFSSPFTARAVYVYVGMFYPLGVAFRQVGTENWERGTVPPSGATVPGSRSQFPSALPSPGPGLLLVQPASQRRTLFLTAAIIQWAATDHAQELIRVARHAQTLLVRHLPAHVELVEPVVERLHAVLLPRLHERVDLMDLVVANERADRRRHDEDLRGHRAPAALGLRQ